MNFDECFSFDNLLSAHKRCRCGKSHKKEVVGFELNLSENLIKLSKEIKRGYKVSKYKAFKIFDPKERLIEALPYKDRLVQMAFCTGLIEPVLEKRLIFDNCACRKGKGTSFALMRLKKFLNEFYRKHGSKGFFLKIDISKYFASINHEILKSKLRKIFSDNKSYDLMCKFISPTHYNGVGIPLGNQTSQWYALLYLDEVDRFIKEKLHIKYYIRYMDDLIVVHKDKNYLRECLNELKKLCESKLKLSLNTKTQIGKLIDGIDFLGFRTILLQSGKVVRVLRKKAKKRLRGKLKFLKILKENGIANENYIALRLNAFWGHIKASNSIYMYNKMISQFGV